MGRKKKEEIEEKSGLSDGAVQAVVGILEVAVGIFFILASLQKGGFLGNKTFEIFTYLLGVGYYLIPILLIILGTLQFIGESYRKFELMHILGALVILLSGLGMIQVLSQDGGVVGIIIAYPITHLLDVSAGMVLLVAFLFIGIILILNTKPSLKAVLFEPFKLWKWFRARRETSVDINEPEITNSQDEEGAEDAPEEEMEEKTDEEEEGRKSKFSITKMLSSKTSDEDFEINTGITTLRTYTPPQISFLGKDKGKPGVGDVKANANIIRRTLHNFGITVEMDEVSIGPSVTRYALKPAEGVKLSKIVALQNDLALALAAHPLRIEAPIPGKSLVGIEIPNSTKTLIGLGSLLSMSEFTKSDKPLLAALGRGVSGNVTFANIAKMPHLLIAGATGSGKSVTVHALITSLLYRNSPENLKFIMVDPKRVELTLYNKIPHLLTPVIKDAKKAIMALKWAAKEMERRYEILESEAVRDVESYHKNILEPELKKAEKLIEDGEDVTMPERMPYIVIIIDELADIMQLYPRELEAAIVRLAQMSRAVGIHLIISTQRPSVNVITGLIKANIPGRIALQVASQIDSRTILDASGAEKLLGAGDMLFMSGDMSKPTRIQSAYISEQEVKKVTSYLADQYKDELPSDIDLGSSHDSNPNSIFDAMTDGGDEPEDDMYEEARQVVIEAGKASTSYIQRKLRVGYARAARLMDMLEERGIIGPADGSKPREVLLGEQTSEESEEAEEELSE